MHLMPAVLLGLVGVAYAQSSLVDAYYARESPIAKAGVLANIGPLGSGAKPGIVIASPSSSNPDYLYTWTRDSAITLRALIDQYVLGDTSLKPTIDDYVNSQAKIQSVPNPSGTIDTGGLGEPKFNIDETAFTGSWGRPQRDGPALRAIALIRYAKFLLSIGDAAYVRNTLWPVIQRDLEYVVENWEEPTFDLWEEVYSLSFFTTAVQHRSLRDGADLADHLEQSSESYKAQAENLLRFLQSYWNSAAGYINANTGGGRSGKDCNTVLASIHTFNPNAGCNATTFQPCSDKALSNLKVYVDTFRNMYSINSGISPSSGVATGRYPEDSYYNGNPWYLTTLAVAEQLYDAQIVWARQGSITVTPTSQSFFSIFIPDISIGTYDVDSLTFINLTSSIRTFADSFVAIVAKYTPETGGLSEQYSKDTGVQTSAKELTWSYVAVLTSFAARNAIAPSVSGLVSGLTRRLSGSEPLSRVAQVERRQRLRLAVSL
ncbi:glucoamylase [Amanita rubescens]|nr:glucoamylase [Amanita rubescens]